MTCAEPGRPLRIVGYLQNRQVAIGSEQHQFRQSVAAGRIGKKTADALPRVFAGQDKGWFGESRVFAIVAKHSGLVFEGARHPGISSFEPPRLTLSNATRVEDAFQRCQHALDVRARDPL